MLGGSFFFLSVYAVANVRHPSQPVSSVRVPALCAGLQCQPVSSVCQIPVSAGFKCAPDSSACYAVSKCMLDSKECVRDSSVCPYGERERGEASIQTYPHPKVSYNKTCSKQVETGKDFPCRYRFLFGRPHQLALLALDGWKTGWRCIRVTTRYDGGGQHEPLAADEIRYAFSPSLKWKGAGGEKEILVRLVPGLCQAWGSN